MAYQKICWYCDYFSKASGKAGNCRRHAPKSIDFQSVPGTAAENGNRVFPYYEDATIEWCGEYKPARVDPGNPPA